MNEAGSVVLVSDQLQVQKQLKKNIDTKQPLLDLHSFVCHNKHFLSHIQLEKMISCQRKNFQMCTLPL